MATAKKTAAASPPAKKVPAKTAPAEKLAAKKAPATARSRAQDRSLVAATQRYEVSYEASKTGHSAADVKAAIAKLGHSRVKVTKALGGS